MASGLGVKKQRGTGLTVLMSLACVVIVVAGLKTASELFIPIMLGVFLAMLSMPILNWVHNRGVPRGLAIFITVLFDLLIVGALVYLTIAVLSSFQDRQADYVVALKSQATTFAESVDENLEKLSGFWDQFGVTSDNTVKTEFPTFKKLLEQYLLGDSNRIVDFIGQTELIGKISSVASKSFFVFIIMIFVLAESGNFSKKLKDVIRVRGPDLRQFQNSSRDIQKYLAIKTGVSALTGLLAWLTCTIFGVDFALLWGLVAFLFNFIPAIGSILAAIPAILLALIDPGVIPDTAATAPEAVAISLNFWSAFGVFICYLAINVGIGNFLDPMLLGDRFGISTVMVILSVLVWGYIWGPVGMFLAVPLTMMMKVIFENSPDLRWISILMGKKSDSTSQ